MTEKIMLQAALQYIEAGLSVIPTNKDKRPALKAWTPYRERKATAEEVLGWFDDNGTCIAVLAGVASANLEILDFDCKAVDLGAWTQYVQEASPGLVERLPLEMSPNGAHVIYRCKEPVPGNSKLAHKVVRVAGPGDHTFRGKKFTARQIDGSHVIIPETIETRGEGGYCLTNPSPGYVLKAGDMLNLPILEPEEREILIEAARAQNEWHPPQETRQRSDKKKAGIWPGEDYDHRGAVREVLQAHGWHQRGSGPDGRERWARPGKGKGYSATLTEGRVFHVFSSNAAPFEPGQAYGPFAVYAHLEHGGDLRAASKALEAKGYGSPRVPHERPTSKASGPTMGDLRQYVDLCVTPGQKITADEICRGLACYRREERKALYAYLGRLCKEGTLRRDDYRHGGYRKVVVLEPYDLSGPIGAGQVKFDLELPLELHNLIEIRANQLLQVSGRYDAGKSAFMFQVMAHNYARHRIVHIVSRELDVDAVKKRMDDLGIPRPHKNITSIEMTPGYEDMIPSGPCIALIDYVRADGNPFETDAQIQRILQNLDGGVAVFATQKHPGLDRPVGGQFAVHASHHIVMLDRTRDASICKIYRTKNERNLEGYFMAFRFTSARRMNPLSDQWKPGTIKWDKPQWKPRGNANDDNNDSNANSDFANNDSNSNKANNDNFANEDNKFSVVNGGGPHVYKERERIKEKDRAPFSERGSCRDEQKEGEV